MLKSFKKKKNNKGFTLVELLVVIAIIGVLAVVAVPSLFKQIDKAKATQVVSNFSAIKTEIMTEYASGNSDEKVVSAVNNYISTDDINLNKKLGESYEVKDANAGSEGQINIVISMPGKETIANNVASQIGGTYTEVGSNPTIPTITVTVGK